MRPKQNSILAPLLILLVTFIAVSGCGSDGDSGGGSGSAYHLPEMVLVPAGTFTMGYGTGEGPLPQGPEHIVTLTDDFEISKHEVTNQEYCDMLNYALKKEYLA